MCAKVLDDLAKGELSLNSVRILTEASWYALTRSVQNYYGWTEVLIGLLVKSNGAGHRLGGTWRRLPPQRLRDRGQQPADGGRHRPG